MHVGSFTVALTKLTSVCGTPSKFIQCHPQVPRWRRFLSSSRDPWYLPQPISIFLPMSSSFHGCRRWGCPEASCCSQRKSKDLSSGNLGQEG